MPTTKLARLTLRGRKEDEGTFAEMNYKMKGMICQGYSAQQLNVGYACRKGIFYCKACGAQVTDWYNGAEFWKCECKQINYIK